MLCVSMFIALTMRNLLPLSITCYPSAWPPCMSPAPPPHSEQGLPPWAPHSLSTPSIRPPPPCPHRVRPRGHAPSGRKSNNCLSAQQTLSRVRTRRRPTQINKTGRVFPGDRLQELAEEAILQIKIPERTAGPEGSWCRGGSGRAGKVNGQADDQ